MRWRRLVAALILCVSSLVVTEGAAQDDELISFGRTEWQHISDSTAGDEFYFAPESLASSAKGIVKIWGKHVYPDAIISVVGCKDCGHTVSQVEIDCSGKKYRIMKSVTYYREGPPQKISRRTSWFPLSPGTFYEALSTKGCP